jgi:hypothetical protein
MLVGDPTATAQTPGLIGQPQQEDPFLPSDLDGILPPPPGDPNHFVEVTGDKNVPPEQKPLAGALATPTPTATPVSPIYKVWDFHVDWIHPGNSRFSLKASLRGAGFTVLGCVDEEGKMTENCVPQKDTPNKLDSSSGFLMFRNAYRRFSDGRESLLNNLTVDAPIGHDSVAAIRWFELQRAIPANWTIRQQSTYRPDNIWRWLGSIASDNQGNIALGFSASSATINPQIRYAGRRATDPLGNLSGEQHLYNGTLSQIGFDPPQGDDPHRWGDYSAMTVDSVDDCTFYYTNEYYICPGCPFFTTPPYTWQTRIGYFRFGQCTPPQKGTGHFVVRFVCDPGTPVASASVSIDGFSYGATLANGTYDAVLPPGSHSYVVSSPAFATQTGNFTISNGQTTVVGVCLGGRAAVADFNGDDHPDYLLHNSSTRETAIWYLNNSLFISGAYGPTLSPGWSLESVADFNLDSHPDYALFAPSTDRTAIWYLNNNVLINALYGPTLPAGWTLIATADFNGDGYPDYVLYNMNNRRTAIWYLNNNVLVDALYGPTLPTDWTLIATADFNGDGHPDYLLYNMHNGRTAIWYLNNNVLVNALYGPTLPVGWAVVATADFNGDGHPDYVLYKARTGETAIWYLNNNILVNAAYGPTLSDAWSLIAP